MRRYGALLAGIALVVGACGTGGVSPTATAGSTPSAEPSAAALATRAPTPEATKPVAVPRPSDLPLDGSCEDENTSCLGLLMAGTTYHTKIFQPPMAFSLPTSDWENRADQGGIFQLLSTTAPGDSISFFRAPTAVDPSIGATVHALATWLDSYSKLQVSPGSPVKVGGLDGITLDIRTAPGATGTDPGCPVRVCVPIFTGNDADTNDLYPWSWDWGNDGSEVQRLYLLTSPMGVIAIFVDSLDGTTFDAMTKAFDQITPTLKFG